MKEIEIRLANSDDHRQIWEIIRWILAQGDTYVFEPASNRQEMLAYWCQDSHHVYVATEGTLVVGTFIIRDNQPGLGAHVANASFMTSPDFTGKGVGTAMGKYALNEARRLGYKSMQFNMVVKTNMAAVKLCQKLGFQIVGEVPEAFDHKKLGLVNAYVMWIKL